jgi:hypothetical protein
MAISKTDVCNMALSLIGDERFQLADFDTDTGKTKRQCALHYDTTLEEVTRLHSWNCSKKRDELTVTEYTEHFWDNQATIPADSIRILTLTNNDTFYRMLRFNTDWAIEGGLILSNSSGMFILYQKIPTIDEMDSLFLRAFYTSLAVKLSIPLTGDRKIRSDLLAEFEQIIMPEARRVNGFEGYEHPVVDSEWLEATYTSTGSVGASWPPISSTYTNGSGFGSI